MSAVLHSLACALAALGVSGAIVSILIAMGFLMLAERMRSALVTICFTPALLAIGVFGLNLASRLP